MSKWEEKKKKQKERKEKPESTVIDAEKGGNWKGPLPKRGQPAEKKNQPFEV